MELAQIRKLSPQINNLAKKYGISRVYISGSTARGGPGPKNDVDFLVEMENGVSLFGAAGFGYECEKLLEIPVDVIPISTLASISDKVFIKNIQKDAVVL